MSFVVRALFGKTTYSLGDQIDRLGSANLNKRRDAAQALYALSENAENQERIAEAGGIGPLVALLSDGDAGVRKWAAGALEKLALNTQNKKHIVEAGGIGPLVALLSDGNAVIRHHAAGAIGEFARNDQREESVREHIGAADAVRRLVSLLPDGNAEVRKQALGALLNLSYHHDQNQKRIAVAQGVGPLICLLSDQDAVIRQRAVGVLRELASNIQIRGRIRESGCVRPLVSLLSDDDTEVRRGAVQVLSLVFSAYLWHGRAVDEVDKRNRQEVVDAGGVRPLLSLLLDGYEGTGSAAADVLWGLTTYPEYRERITEAGAIRALVGALASPTALGQQGVKNAEGALWGLLGGTMGLLSLLLDQDTRVREWGVRNIRERAFNQQEHIAEAGGIKPLISLLSDADKKIRREAAASLWNLAAYYNKNQERIAEAEGIRPLIALLSDRDIEARREAAGALWHLAANDKNKESIAEAGGVGVFVSLLSDRDTLVRRKAAWVLWILAANDKNQERIAGAGGIGPLVVLLADQDTVVRQKAAGALSGLALNVQNKERIAAAGGVGPLVSLLSDPDTEVRTQATGALLQMVAHEAVCIDAGSRQVLSKQCDHETNSEIKAKLRSILERCTLKEGRRMEPDPQGRSASVPNKINAKGARARPVRKQAMEPKLTPKASAAPVRAPEVANVQKISLAQIKLGRSLGRGAYGEVCEGEYQFQKVAIKKYTGTALSQNDYRKIEAELLVMSRLNQEHLVRLLGVIEVEGEPPRLVMECGTRGSLYGYLREASAVSWGWRLEVAEDLARGLAYLHEHDILHRDIKSLNVVLDARLKAKWCDFGLAVLKQHATATQTQHGEAVGTIRWMAPELFEDRPVVSKKNDIWSYGMLLFELATGKVPYEDLENRQVMMRVLQHKPEAVPERCRAEAPQYAGLMAACWQERTLRPEAAHLVDVLSGGPSEPGEASTQQGLESDFIGLSV